jgi:hypothetical protein
MRIVILLAVIFIGLSSCKKRETDTENFWECHKSQNLDSLSISNKLIGSWEWQKRLCFWANREEPADKNIKLTINSNGRFSVSEAGSVITQGNWRLMVVDIGMWGLDLTVESEYLYGRILFCGSKLLFNDTYIDGCDNTFSRIN